MTMLRSVLLLSLAMVTQISSAPAQDGPPASSLHWFDSFDQNKDAVLMPTEIRSVGERQFGRFDANKDGALSEKEYAAGIPEAEKDELERTRRRFAIMDRNGDGKATMDEFIAFGVRVIEIGDENGNRDGSMSRDEFIAQIVPE
jgi:hypothetical protein